MFVKTIYNYLILFQLVYKLTGNTSNHRRGQLIMSSSIHVFIECEITIMLSTSFIDLFGKFYIGNRKFWLRYKRWNLRLNSTLGDWKIICNSRKFAINKFAINEDKMYRLCTFLAGELEKLRNKRKFAISVFVISEFYCMRVQYNPVWHVPETLFQLESENDSAR